MGKKVFKGDRRMIATLCDLCKEPMPSYIQHRVKIRKKERGLLFNHYERLDICERCEVDIIRYIRNKKEAD